MDDVPIVARRIAAAEKEPSMRKIAFGAAVGFTAALVGALAIAQPMEVVTVEAARSQKIAQSEYGVPIEEITIRSRVSYSDLDLTTAAGVSELEKRVRQAANASCKEIDVKFPAQGSSEASCVKSAIDGAMAEARKVIDAKQAAKGR